MAHIEIDKDGMKVLVVSDMGARFDPVTDKELPRRKVENLEIVHSTEIARYYGLDHGDTGYGDNQVLGTWALVHGNIIGQRVAYNNEASAPLDRLIRVWEVEKDNRGVPIDTKEKIVVNTNKHLGALTYALTEDLDDGMYVRYADLVRFAKAQGWTKNGGWPAQRPIASNVDVAAIVAAVMQAMQAQKPAPLPASEPRPPAERSPKQLAHDAWMAAGKPEPRDEWKIEWMNDHGAT